MHGLKMDVAINKNGNIKYKRIAEYISLLKKLKIDECKVLLSFSLLSGQR